VFYIISTASIIVTIRHIKNINNTSEESQDKFLHWPLAALCFVLAVITYLIQYDGRPRYDDVEVFWIFSIYLEAIAILPQRIVLQQYCREREIDYVIGYCIFGMGAYRALYVLNWIYRTYFEVNYIHHWVVSFCGVVQVMLYFELYWNFIASPRDPKLVITSTDAENCKEESHFELLPNIEDDSV
jgi:ER lumen protein retaining receptor